MKIKFDIDGSLNFEKPFKSDFNINDIRIKVSTEFII